MKEKVKLGYIGLGRRGWGMLKYAICKMADVEITVICDLDEKKIAEAVKIIEEAGYPTPIVTTDYHEVLNNPEIDAVMLFTGWDSRVKLAMESMRAGKYTAIEVGCADTLQECFDLVDTYEETGMPCMMLENCCYGKRELMALNMARQGLLGEIFHCEGGYCHYLNEDELFLEMLKDGKDDINHYRLNHYINDNCENYPTHELGPISKLLRINRGNRMLTLTSMASKSVGLRDFATEKFGKDSKYANINYRQGDIVQTLIKCAGGETILLTLDTTTPRNQYSRQFTVRGTRGMTHEDTKSVHLQGMKEPTLNNEDEMFEKYGHPLNKEVQQFETEATRIKVSFGLHSGGIDWMVFRAFIESVKNGTPPPIDVYDTAAWLAIGPLTRASIENGSAPVEVPDFTKGKWQNREPLTLQKYCLDEVVVDEKLNMYACLNPTAKVSK